MKVILKPISGTPKDNLDSAKHKMERVLSFRGRVDGTKVAGKRIVVKVEINPKWELSPEERVAYLKEWIHAKVRGSFKVLKVSTEDEAK